MTYKHQNNRISTERCRHYRREAREVFAFRANHLNVLFALLAVIFFCACAVFFADCFYRALALSNISLQNEQLLSVVYRVCSILILFLLLSPLYMGLVTYLVDVYHTRSANIGHVPQTGLFCFYAGIESAVRAWLVTLVRLIGVALYPISAQLIFILAKYMLPFFGKHNTVGVAIGILLLITISLFLLSAVLTLDLYFKTVVIYAVMRPTSSIFFCLRIAASHVKAHFTEGLLLLLDFTPWMILSVLSAGVLFFLFVLPYILFSEISYSVHLMMEAKEP